MKTLTAIFVLLMLSTAAYAADPLSIDGFKLPGGYIKKFPVGEVTAEQLLSANGAPTREMNLAGSTVWVYERQETDSKPASTWTFFLDSEQRVSRVIYKAQGGANFDTAN